MKLTEAQQLIKRKTGGYPAFLICYLFWGFQPLYWQIMPGLDSMFTMAARIVWAALLLTALLAFTGRLGELWAALRDKKTMKYLAPASLFLFLDWTVYLLAVKSGHVLDASLGYYMNPLLIFLLGVIVYRERCSRAQYAAVGLVVVGVTVSALGFKSFPYISVIIAANWAVYAAISKNVPVDGVISIAVETLLLTPVAIIYVLLFRAGDNGLASVTLPGLAFLIGGGFVTVMPTVLYANGMLWLPLTVVSFFQYLSPTLSMFAGLAMGEEMTAQKLVTFAFIWAGIIVFSASELIRMRGIKQNKKEPEA